MDKHLQYKGYSSPAMSKAERGIGMAVDPLSPDRGTEGQEARAKTQQRTQWERYQRRLWMIFPFLLVLIFLVYGFTTHFIPSPSMEPTIKVGDHILVMRSWLAYPFGRMPARGDIITFVIPLSRLGEGESEEEARGRVKVSPLFSEPRKGEDLLIKRVAGLPGETIQIVGRDLFINGKKTPVDFPVEADPSFGYPYAVDKPLTLGPDELFVLGDNPDNSEDSRFWGPLKREEVLGKFIGVLFHEGAGGPNRRAAREASY